MASLSAMYSREREERECCYSNTTLIYCGMKMQNRGAAGSKVCFDDTPPIHVHQHVQFKPINTLHRSADLAEALMSAQASSAL